MKFEVVTYHLVYHFNHISWLHSIGSVLKLVITLYQSCLISKITHAKKLNYWGIILQYTRWVIQGAHNILKHRLLIITKLWRYKTNNTARFNLKTVCCLLEIQKIIRRKLHGYKGIIRLNITTGGKLRFIHLNSTSTKI